jgi:hypothetical protein
VDEIVTEAAVLKRHPAWSTWAGTDQRMHARRTAGAALVVNGESWQDLDDEIVKAERKLEDAKPGAWT